MKIEDIIKNKDYETYLKLKKLAGKKHLKGKRYEKS